jgi:hypothetical protein
MLPLAIFMSICVGAVLFLLRFLFALEAETRTARPHSALRGNGTSRTQPYTQVRDLPPGLALVYSHVSRQAGVGRPMFARASDPRERNSQYKGA